MSPRRVQLLERRRIGLMEQLGELTLEPGEPLVQPGLLLQRGVGRRLRRGDTPVHLVHENRRGHREFVGVTSVDGEAEPADGGLEGVQQFGDLLIEGVDGRFELSLAANPGDGPTKVRRVRSVGELRQVGQSFGVGTLRCIPGLAGGGQAAVDGDPRGTQPLDPGSLDVGDRRQPRRIHPTAGGNPAHQSFDVAFQVADLLVEAGKILEVQAEAAELLDEFFDDLALGEQ